MNLIDSYITWLKSKFEESQVDHWVEVVTPFIDRNNDHIQIYLQQKNGTVNITDDGATFSNLDLAGFSKTEKRADILATVFRGFGVQWGNDEDIQLSCKVEEFPSRFHAFLQTILSVDNLGYFSEQNVKSMFFEDVAAWLGQNGLSYHAKKEYHGKSGLDVQFPFYIPAQKQLQSGVVQLINNPRTNIKPLIFEWIDTEKSRDNSITISLINDSSIQAPRKLVNAFEEYEINVIPWSKKEDLIELLTA